MTVLIIQYVLDGHLTNDAECAPHPSLHSCDAYRVRWGPESFPITRACLNSRLSVRQQELEGQRHSAKCSSCRFMRTRATAIEPVSSSELLQQVEL